MNQNKLTLNTEKTKIIYNGTTLERVNNYKYLGVNVDYTHLFGRTTSITPNRSQQQWLGLREIYALLLYVQKIKIKIGFRYFKILIF